LLSNRSSAWENKNPELNGFPATTPSQASALLYTREAEAMDALIARHEKVRKTIGQQFVQNETTSKNNQNSGIATNRLLVTLKEKWVSMVINNCADLFAHYEAMRKSCAEAAEAESKKSISFADSRKHVAKLLSNVKKQAPSSSTNGSNGLTLQQQQQEVLAVDSRRQLRQIAEASLLPEYIVFREEQAMQQQIPQYEEAFSACLREWSLAFGGMMQVRETVNGMISEAYMPKLIAMKGQVFGSTASETGFFF